MRVDVRGTGPLRPTFAADLVRAYQLADVSAMVGLALRRHRSAVRMSQRAYAQWRGWSKGRQGRLEGSAGNQRLEEVVCALRGTGYRLALIHDGDEVLPRAAEPLAAVADPGDLESLSGRKRESAHDRDIAAYVAVPSDWDISEFVAKDEAGRKFPAHKEVRRTTEPPLWWMFRHSTSRGIWPEWTTAE